MPGIDSNTKLLLHCNTDPFADASPAAHGNATKVGTAQLDTSVKKFGAGALKLDGDSDYIYYADHADWDILGSTSNDVTLDFWIKFVNPNPNNYPAILGQVVVVGDTFWLIYQNADGSTDVVCYDGGVYKLGINSGVGSFSDTNWHHFAFIKKGTVCGIYIDGVQKGYGLQLGISNLTAPLQIGFGAAGWCEYFNGNLDELRIQYSNYFNANPNVGKTDTIIIPTSEYMAGKPSMIFNPYAGSVALVNDSVADSKALVSITSASTADSKAVVAQASASTADSKAVIAQSSASTADSKAVVGQDAASTADSKAVVAGTDASTADSKGVVADSKAVSAGTAASTADSKAVVGQDSASTADSKAVVADSKAVSAGALASEAKSIAETGDASAISVADSKAVSAGVAASTADSKAVVADASASTADSKTVLAESVASSADSKAVAGQTAASTADSKGVVADSKAVSSGTAASTADSKAASVGVITDSAIGSEPGIGEYKITDMDINADGSVITEFDDSAIGS